MSQNWPIINVIIFRNFFILLFSTKPGMYRCIKKIGSRTEKPFTIDRLQKFKQYAII